MRSCDCIQEQRADTRENVERRMARTADELMEDQLQEEEEEEEEVESEGEGDEVPYNPKNLPLGWDGKVTTLWLISNSLPPSPSLSSANTILAIQTTRIKYYLFL